MNEHFFRFPLNTLELEFLHKQFLVSISLHSISIRRRSVECLCSFPRLPIKVVDTCFEIVDLRPLIVLPTLHLQKQMPNCSHEPVNRRILSKLETFTYLLGLEYYSSACVAISISKATYRNSILRWGRCSCATC